MGYVHQSNYDTYIEAIGAAEDLAAIGGECQYVTLHGCQWIGQKDYWTVSETRDPVFACKRVSPSGEVINLPAHSIEPDDSMQEIPHVAPISAVPVSISQETREEFDSHKNDGSLTK